MHRRLRRPTVITAVTVSTVVTVASLVLLAGAPAGAQDVPGPAPEPTTTTEPETPPPPPPAPPVDPAGAEERLARQVGAVHADVAERAADVEAATRQVQQRTDQLTAARQQLARRDVDRHRAVDALRLAQARFRERVADAVVRGNAAELDTLLKSVEPDVLERRKIFLSSISEADRDAVEDLRDAQGSYDQRVREAIEAVARARREVRGAHHALELALGAHAERTAALDVLAAAGEIIVRGAAFPVAEPYSFIDSWGYPRMTGTEYEHGHEGVDIMAPHGSPLYAVERGVITRVGTDVLGGTKLWLDGESGLSYYYAHMSGYAEGIAEGTVVEAGTVVGFVGDSGNARGGEPHLHLQIHPGGGDAVNPYDLLRVVSDLSRR